MVPGVPKGTPAVITRCSAALVPASPTGDAAGLLDHIGKTSGLAGYSTVGTPQEEQPPRHSQVGSQAQVVRAL